MTYSPLNTASPLFAGTKLGLKVFGAAIPLKHPIGGKGVYVIKKPLILGVQMSKVTSDISFANRQFCDNQAVVHSLQFGVAEPTSSGGQEPTKSAAEKVPLGVPVALQRAAIVKSPFLHESTILSMNSRSRVDLVRMAMSAGETVSPSFFGYIFLEPRGVDIVLEGVELMKKHWTNRKHIEKV